MGSACWTSKDFKNLDNFPALHNPRIFADAFGVKRPLEFCANVDCIYKKEDRCPAGSLKKTCPNISKLDNIDGCPYFIGKKFQSSVLRESLDGTYKIHTTITGRGTGKTSIINTRKAIMECTTEPYIRGMLYNAGKPVPTIVICIGHTKEGALLLRNSINAELESSELLNSMIHTNTKTYIRFKNGSEIFIKTAGVDGRGIRGFHAKAILDSIKRVVKCTIILIVDEGCFVRAQRLINEICRPELANGNIFSQLFITSTPWAPVGEVWDLWDNPAGIVNKHHFASFNNPFSDLDLILDARRRLLSAGLGGIYNREFLGLFQADTGLFWPFHVWSRTLDDSLDWLFMEDIEKFDHKIPGKYYLGVDPNKFLQTSKGDFAAYLLMSVSSDRRHVRSISFGKFQMDLEDEFLDKLVIINRVFKPKVICDENSGMVRKLRELGMDVMGGKNDNTTKYRAMAFAKLDAMHGVWRQPPSQVWDDERRFYILKDPDPGVITPKLEAAGEWGQGFNDDLMDTLHFGYQGMMEDFNLSGIVDSASVGTSEAKSYVPSTLSAYDKFRIETIERYHRLMRN